LGHHGDFEGVVIVLELPLPPSTNDLFANVSREQRAAARARGMNLPGRVRTKNYNAWIKEAGWMLKAQRQKPVKGPVNIEYFVCIDAKADLGNLEKAATDLLVSHGMIEGDDPSVVKRIVMQWSEDVPALRLCVTPAVTP
jgi:Holliday junction resolvase RusA-like endonuclease